MAQEDREEPLGEDFPGAPPLAAATGQDLGGQPDKEPQAPRTPGDAGRRCLVSRSCS